MRILYVEDNPANISLLQRVARMGGHEVLYYNEGEKALENFAKDNPDLILMDLQLAGKMGGLDVVRKLRSDGVEKPIVAVTAYAMMGDKDRCLEAGCDAYLSKPLPVAELVEMVSMYQEKVNAAAAAAIAPAPAAETAVPEASPAEAASSEKPAAEVSSAASPEPAAKPAESAAPAEVSPPVKTETIASSAPQELAAPKSTAALEPVPVTNQNGHKTPVR
ncbi:MAG: response regulator [Anaerolineae bacterium]|nr:response regulator [Anaerolineae bacterium]